MFFLDAPRLMPHWRVGRGVLTIAWTFVDHEKRTALAIRTRGRLQPRPSKDLPSFRASPGI